MSYEINVSLNGKHLFATTKRSAQFKEEATTLFMIMKDKFPQSEGYEIMINEDPGVSYGRTNEFEQRAAKIASLQPGSLWSIEQFGHPSFTVDGVKFVETRDYGYIFRDCNDVEYVVKKSDIMTDTHPL